MYWPGPPEYSRRPTVVFGADQAADSGKHRRNLPSLGDGQDFGISNVSCRCQSTVSPALRRICRYCSTMGLSRIMSPSRDTASPDASYSFSRAKTFFAFVSYLLIPTDPYGISGWRWVVLIGSSGAIAAWWLRMGLAESPRWLAQHGQSDVADRIVADLELRVEADLGYRLPAPQP